MYHIIGVDGKEYGPVSAGQLTQWLAENRVNGQSLVREEGGNWKPLREHAEFASLPTGGQPPTMPGSAPRPPGSPSDAVSTIIPYRNAAALSAYYLAVFSVIPCVGALLGIAALVARVKICQAASGRQRDGSRVDRRGGWRPLRSGLYGPDCLGPGGGGFEKMN